ncbi:BAG domain [Dillenia turbinata]|uniref:BAG domain n=1 Tax=Dillenia turbinata TaxID=194707 RepID=A0AAN8VBV1_9MAGN
MLKRRTNFNGRAAATTATATTTTSKDEEIEWEMRPGGMLVQKRSDARDNLVTYYRLRVAYDAARYEISISSQATFGELKKLLAAETGLKPGEQRLIFRGKERENGDYLDMSGVKDRSEVILMEDPSSKEKRFIEMRRNAIIQSAHRAISDVSMEVDKMADQVSAIEKSIQSGNKVPEVQITTLIEMLMRQAVKLDSISAEGDASTQKLLQGKRVQKCVETLDVLKVSNAKVLKPVVVTTKWETFDPPLPPPPIPPSTTHWEFFD